MVLRGVRIHQKSTEFLLPKEVDAESSVVPISFSFLILQHPLYDTVQAFARIVASVSVRVCPSLLLSCFALRALHHYVEAELIHLSKVSHHYLTTRCTFLLLQRQRLGLPLSTILMTILDRGIGFKTGCMLLWQEAAWLASFRTSSLDVAAFVSR